MKTDRSLAFVFPGQGSQSVGMLKELADAYPVVGDAFAEAGRVLGFDLWGLVQAGPESELNLTVNTQPALLAAGVAAWRAWLGESGVRPGVAAGHSLGEYTALVCAGSLEFEEAVVLVADRGRYMQEAVADGEGAMAAVMGLSAAQVEAICAEAAGTQVVAPANDNSPGQIVISGHRKAVGRAMEAALAAGAKRAIVLNVSVPSHCALMAPAARKLSRRLESVRVGDATIPVVQNVDALGHTDAASIRQALVGQLHAPVRWVECVRRMKALGATHVIECGPGRILAGLVKRIEPDLSVASLGDPPGLRKALEMLA